MHSENDKKLLKALKHGWIYRDHDSSNEKTFSFNINPYYHNNRISCLLKSIKKRCSLTMDLF